jgi:hypothetical protein
LQTLLSDHLGLHQGPGAKSRTSATFSLDAPANFFIQTSLTLSESRQS